MKRIACHEAGITAFVPKTKTSGATFDGRFGKEDFIYDAEKNEYRCPAGERLIWRYRTTERGLKLDRYWSSQCQQCSLKDKCTPSTERRVTRWEHEGLLEEMQVRLDLAPDMMRIRRQTVEHPFGTIKAWMGATHFLTPTIELWLLRRIIERARASRKSIQLRVLRVNPAQQFYERNGFKTVRSSDERHFMTYGVSSL